MVPKFYAVFHICAYAALCDNLPIPGLFSYFILSIHSKSPQAKSANILLGQDVSTWDNLILELCFL